MADIINLKHARKQKDRQERESQAATNREKYGRTKADKELAKRQQELSSRTLDGHKRDD
jgi:hypothetical protein